MARRVFEIAKELGLQSKAIVEKCHAEGISEDVVKNHMSTVSAGLEATIREWFSAGGGGTAVETAAKVDLSRVKAARKARPIKPPADSADEDKQGERSSDGPGPENGDAAHAGEHRAGDEIPARSATTIDTHPRSSIQDPLSQDVSGQAASRQAPAGPAGARDVAASRAEQASSAGAGLAPGGPRAPGRAAGPGGGSEATGRDAARAGGPGATRVGPARGEGGAQTGSPAGSQGEATDGGAPPQMNVPRRPTVVAPAGRQLQKKAPVKLSGPKVVRVEAPEVIEAPRRRPGPPTGGGGGGGPARAPGGRGVGMPAPDPSRAPRRGVSTRRKTDRESESAEKRKKVVGDEWAGGPSKFSEADLAEREARLQRSGGYLKQRRQQMKRQQQGDRGPSGPRSGERVTIAAPFTIKDLSSATGIKGAEIVKRLFMQGVMAGINSGIDPERAQEVMMDFDIELEVTTQATAEQVVERQFEGRERVDDRPRGPVVTILGHVDHGKTSLLDKIRNANVAAGEAGGITQATSAFRVPVQLGDEEKFIVFIDTPGHEAFTEMRSRGANVTDIVVLVVAADDGVMPQTIESINHAKAAGVPIVVALNKIDKPEATDSNIQRILGQLAEHGLNPVEWGGDTEVVRTSAITGRGVQDLLEILDIQAQVLELTADFGGQAQGTVIEARVEQGRGPVANVLVQDGELKVGDFVVAGRGFGRVRDITDDRGNRVKCATPPAPVQISGLDEVPDAGDKFYVVDSLKKAQEAAEQRRDRERQKQLARPKVTLDSMFSQMADTQIKEILVVVKADVQGSVDVLRNEIEKIASDEVRTRVLHAAVGGVSESDVLLAEASGAVIVGFNVIPSGKARQMAESKGVEIRAYRVIYDLVEDLTKAAEGLLRPDLREEVLGHAEVRQVFRVSRVGAIAGCYVTDGVVQRDAYIRVTRAGVVVEHDRKLEQLKRFKDDVKEVRSNMECGMKIEHYDDIKEGDVLECYKKVEVKRTL